MNVEPFSGLNAGETTFSIFVYVAVEISELAIPLLTAIVLMVVVEFIVNGEVN